MKKMRLLLFVTVVSAATAAILSPHDTLACIHEPREDEFVFDVSARARAPAPALRLRSGAQRGDAHEAVAISAISPDRLRSSMQTYTSRPHLAGTEGDYAMARWTLAQFTSLGFDAHIEEFDTLLAYPVSRSLRAVEAPANGADPQQPPKVVWTASLQEQALPSDPASQWVMRNETWLGYGPSGHATAPVVYVNYCQKADFEALPALGVSVTGRIVLCRYGMGFRGLKVMLAQQQGAVGVVIFSDPSDDGFGRGEVYPNGPWRPPTSVQRGSVQFSALCEGDPARAYSEESVEELCGYSQEEIIPRVPVLPISYADAEPILKMLGGQPVPASWKGALDLEYRTGPSTVHLQLNVESRFETKPIPNVIATLKGSAYGTVEDQPVILGNHRDAWTPGAADPHSGSVALIEVAHALAHLRNTKQWTPRRTIVLCSWSGEEYGLLGSVAWAETHRHDGLRSASVYLNVDVGVSGSSFRVAGDMSASTVLAAVLRDAGDSTWDHRVATLGDGSDFAAFTHHLGIPSLDMKFAEADRQQYGVYHSIYDDYTWMQLVDPEYSIHARMSEIWTRLALRFADAQQLPLDVVALAEGMESMVSHVRDFPPLGSLLKLERLEAAVAEFGAAAAALADVRPLAERNRRAGLVERKLCVSQGLPDRRWFKSVMHAPVKELGYGGDVFPGVVQALRESNAALAQEQVEVAADAIRKASLFLRGVPLGEGGDVAAALA